MAMLPRRFASLAVAGFLAVTCFDMVTGLEHWPFGSYPMYSGLYGEQLDLPRLYGVRDGAELALRGDSDFAPFDEARLIMALERLQRARGGEQKLDEALRNLMGLYNRRNAPGGPIRALRLYNVHVTPRPGLQGLGARQERTLIAQVGP